MGCLSNKFVINKGLSNDFIITIKQNDSTLPMVIEPTDTFKMVLYKLSTNSAVAEVTMTQTDNGIIEVYDDANGQIKISLSESLVSTLDTEFGNKEDRYYVKPMYRLAIDCSTTNNGNFVASISEVYVR